MRRVDSHCQSFLLLSLLLILFAVNLCSANDKSFEVVGTGECADCKENNFKTSQAFSGLRVTIDCKIKNGDMKRIGSTELDEQGNFKVSIPQDLVENGQKLKHECYAQLHSAAAIPCPAHNGLEASKIIFKSQTNNGKHVFVPTKTLQFSAALCTSKFFWPYFKYPPLPPLKHFGHPWLFPPLPPLYKPKPLPPPVPVYEPPVSKPLPPPAPVYKPEPPTPVYKPKPPTPVYKPEPKPKPPTPVYKPKPKPEPKPPTPVYKPKPKPEPKPKPPAPVYKPKPEPPVVKPPTPVYKPKPPVYKPPKKPCPPIEPNPPVYKPPVYKPPVVKPLPPPIPIYKPPVVKPLPPPIPLYPIPPITKKPCPPLPKLPPFPKIPPKYFHHPKFGHFPPLPPTIPHA